MLGLLGALDPYKHKVNIGMIDQSRDASAVSLSESKSSQDSCKHLGKHLFWFLFQVNIQRASVYKQVVAFFFCLLIFLTSLSSLLSKLLLYKVLLKCYGVEKH